MNSAGKFVFVWHSADADSDGIWFRVYNANGTTATNEQAANSTTNLRQSFPRVDYVSDRIAIVWRDAGNDGNGEGSFGRVFYDTALSVTSEIQLNSTTTGNQNYPKVFLDSTGSGSFVAIWQGDSGIRMRRFNASTGASQSGEVTVYSSGSASWIYHDNNNNVMPIYSYAGDIRLKRYKPDLSSTLYARNSRHFNSLAANVESY